MRGIRDVEANVEGAVRRRYAGAARAIEPELCCPVSYDPRFLKAIPEDVLARDYGCGDPSRHLRAGETVLDLGSGAGKICFIASQVVGPSGRVIGIDMNDEMLRLARRSAPAVAAAVGVANVWFGKGRIQDLALDLDRLESHLDSHPVRTLEDLGRLEAETARLRAEAPLVAPDSIDVVISNCVLNLVRSDDKWRLFGEIFRVLKRGGRAVISDIVSDEDVPLHLQQDAELWSGCMSGALREGRFLQAFEDAGFCGVSLAARAEQPWRVVDGIEFRSVTVLAYKGKEGACLDHRQALIYRGPFRQVVEPRVAVDPRDAKPFPCGAGALVRSPRETKGADDTLTTGADDHVCASEGGCC
jgi:SAM-dependent methyltransferase